MATVTLQPIEEAVQRVSERTPVGSLLRTAEWERVPQALRERGQFSAGVESARVVDRIQKGIRDIVEHNRDAAGVIEDRSRFIRDLTQLAIEEGLEPAGLEPADPDLRGTIQDITSERRARLIYDQQIQQAYGFANWKSGEDPDALDAAPAQELVRIRDSRVKRNWINRWRADGGRVFPGVSASGLPLQAGTDGRAIALKTDPIWTSISRFGNPWPPYDFGSGIWVEDVLRPEAVELGLITPQERPEPIEPDFNATLEAGVTNLGEDVLNELRTAFGNQIVIEGSRVRWRGGAA